MKKGEAMKSIPLYKMVLSAKAVKEVNDSLKSGWLSPGPKVAEFEKEICQLTQMKYGTAVGSATAGLQLVLETIGAEPGKEVITTPFTFVATVVAILATGATPVMADIDPSSLNIDPEEVFRKINNHTVAVMPVDIAGYPVNYTLLNKICTQMKLPLIADAAHSIGTLYKNKPVTKYVDAAVISFHATKNLICGEGGMVLSKHKGIIDAIKIMSRHGLTSTAYQRKQKNKWEYDAVYPGWKANMAELHAAVGLGQLSVFKKEQVQRKKLAEKYLSCLADVSEYLEVPHQEKEAQPGWHLFIIRLHLSRPKINRNQFIKLMAEAGVECGVHYKPIFELSYYSQLLDVKPQFLPNTVYAGKRVVTLPLYPTLTTGQVEYICDKITAIVKKHRR